MHRENCHPIIHITFYTLFDEVAFKNVTFKFFKKRRA